MSKLNPKIVNQWWKTIDKIENEMLPYEIDAMLITIAQLKLILTDWSNELEQKKGDL